MDFTPDAQEVAKSLGVDANPGDRKAQAQAMADHINGRGGVAGRKIVLVWHEVNTPQRVANPHAAAQAACSTWTEDNKVFAVLHNLAGDQVTLAECLAKRKTVMVDVPSLHKLQASVYTRLAPYLYAPSETSLERWTRAWVRRLEPLGYFRGWDTVQGQPGNAPVKIGVVREKRYPHKAALVEKELSLIGRSVTSRFEVSGGPERYSDQMVLAVRQFQGAGVTHVFAPGLVFYMMSPADSQRYRPRYSASVSTDGFIDQTAPPRQLAGALAVGVIPDLDVDDARRDPGDGAVAGRAQCRKIMEGANQDTSNRVTFGGSMARICDQMNFLASAVNKGALSAEGIMRGAAAIGSMPSATTFRISFAGGRPFGASAVRDVGWLEGNECPNRRQDRSGCFVYLSNKNHAM